MENTKETLQKAILAIKEVQNRTTSVNQQLGHAQAMDILEDFIFLEELKDPPKQHLIIDIEMPIRLQNSLKHHGFNYLEDLVELTEKQFSYYRNIGRKQIYDLKIILEKYNLKFKNN
jgi:DNA-directed RNA polymerase alpha subunit